MPARPPSRPVAALAPALRLWASLVGLALLAGCASHGPNISAPQEAAIYREHARVRNYTPPGPPADPWGPYIDEASTRFDVPQRWVRGVMRQESGGRLYENGELITSWAGAMGLMQVMPGTYDELRSRYGLGDDPYDPHDNILAGTAYIRELYDVYGAPGFLAAYNAGPGRMDDYLTRNKSLPLETRNYVARIAPGIMGDSPNKISPAQMMAVNQIPINIPAGPRYPRGRGRYDSAPVALADNRGRISGYRREPVMTASLPVPPPLPPGPAPAYAARLQLASATPARDKRGGFRLISRAMADTVPVRTGGPSTGSWAIQVGAFSNQGLARSAAENARGQATILAAAHPAVGSVHTGKSTLYRARLTGLSREAAIQACGKLRGKGCIVISPDAQS